MIGYMFVCGVDGFGADVAPVFDEPIFLSLERAFARQCELNSYGERVFYEDGYGEDYYPETNAILAKAEEEEDWDTYEEEMEKHSITDIAAICRLINSQDPDDCPPIGYYKIVEVEICR